MQALWLEDGVLSLRDVALPSPPPGEVMIRVDLAGICNTDQELRRGYYPFTGIPGHEFVGTVEKGPTELRGRRVVGEINVACGDCAVCRSGHPTHCENRTVLGIKNRNGAFARYTTLPANNMHLVPDNVSDDAAVFTEPLAAALQVQEQVKVKPSDRVAVIGDGKLGNLVAQTLSLTGCELYVLGRHEEKWVSLKSRGIRTTLDPGDLSGMDLVVECTGNSDGIAAAIRAVRPRGTVVMKSTYEGQLTLDSSAIVVNEINLVGSRCGPFEPALHLIENGEVELKQLVDSRFPLSDSLRAFERAATRGVMKVLLEP